MLWQKNIYILYKTKNKNKNNTLVQLIESRWSDLKDKIKEMSEDEKKKKKKNEQPNKRLKIVEKIIV